MRAATAQVLLGPRFANLVQDFCSAIVYISDIRTWRADIIVGMRRLHHPGRVIPKQPCRNCDRWRIGCRLPGRKGARARILCLRGQRLHRIGAAPGRSRRRTYSCRQTASTNTASSLRAATSSSVASTTNTAQNAAITSRAVNCTPPTICGSDKNLHLFHAIARKDDGRPVAAGGPMLIHVHMRSGSGGTGQGECAYWSWRGCMRGDTGKQA